MKVIRFMALFFFLLLAQGIATSEGYRPNYSFDDDVFSELPVYPDDFDEVIGLYRNQKITASQLSIEYLQPEILPTWDYFAERVYGENGQSMGSYGIFFYPSNIVFSNVSEGDTFRVSTLVYSQWGIRFYQGLKLGFNNNSNITIDIVQPGNPNILLYPTYPRFKTGWMQIIEFNVSVLKTGNHVIILSEQKPDDTYNTVWSKTYEDKYISGFGFMAMQTPRFQIYIYPPVPDTSSVNEPDNSFVTMWFLSIFFIFIVSTLLIIRWCYSKKRETKME